MIVDKKIDLNIYKERNGEDSAASCCTPLSNAEATAPTSCCAPSSSCYSNGISLKSAVDIDLNQWVSKYYPNL
jgi:hypothetical protein